MLAFIKTQAAFVLVLLFSFFLATPISLAAADSAKSAFAKQKEIVSPLYLIKSKHAIFRRLHDSHYQLMIPVRHIITIEQIADRPHRFLATVEPKNLVPLIAKEKHKSSHDIANMRLRWTHASKNKELDQAIFTITNMKYSSLFIRFELEPLHTNQNTRGNTLPKRMGPISAYVAN